MKKIAVITAALGALALYESDASACGACIHPSENPTVVTDHRMVFTISPAQSTLYDQIRYSGSPSSFGWVLPFAGEIEVGVSSDVVFGVLDQQTQTQIFAPPMNCPAYPAACVVPGNFADAASAKASIPESGVTVLKREVVGPYDTAQLKATDPNALADWAAKNGFVIRDEQKPVIAAYQAEHFNFLAVKLVPGAGVQDMRPIRVTTKGASLSLPLRMVAVGAGATLGITLWVLAETRFEPTNFTTFAIATDELAWDWTANKSNYLDLRAEKTAAANGRAWELESSITMPASQLRSAILRGSFNPNGGASSPDYEAEGQKSADEVRDDDLATLLAGLPEGVRVTRLRADLARAALDQDLTLGASGDRSELPTRRQITREANEPLCPVYSNCQQVGTAPRSQAAAQTKANPNDASGGDEDDGCSASRSREGQGWFFALAGLFAFSLQRKFRRRRF